MTNENPVDWNDYANAVAPLPTATNEMMTGVAPTNTISVNPDDGSGGAPEVSGGGGAFTWLVVIGAAVAGLAWLGKKFKASTIAFEKSAEDGLIDGILGLWRKMPPIGMPCVQSWRKRCLAAAPCGAARWPTSCASKSVMKSGRPAAMGAALRSCVGRRIRQLP